MAQIILASASPRRKELLEQIDVSFEVCPAKGEEKITKDTPEEVVTELSGQKCKRGNRQHVLLTSRSTTRP